MTVSCFVTGTDTGVGKTLVSCGLLAAARSRGLRCLGLKPIAAGCELHDGNLRNEDALLLQNHANVVIDYGELNPIALPAAVAPHIAARQAGVTVTVAQLAAVMREPLSRETDLIIVEGAGGWRVPLNEQETLADLVTSLRLPVVLVVGLRLGCINHALLTAEAIRADGLQLLAWVGNCGDQPMACQDENIATLNARLDAPCLGVVPWLERGDIGDLVAPWLEISAIGLI